MLSHLAMHELREDNGCKLACVFLLHVGFKVLDWYGMWMLYECFGVLEGGVVSCVHYRGGILWWFADSIFG